MFRSFPVSVLLPGTFSPDVHDAPDAVGAVADMTPAELLGDNSCWIGKWAPARWWFPCFYWTAIRGGGFGGFILKEFGGRKHLKGQVVCWRFLRHCLQIQMNGESGYVQWPNLIIDVTGGTNRSSTDLLNVVIWWMEQFHTIPGLWCFPDASNMFDRMPTGPSFTTQVADLVAGMAQTPGF